MASDNKIFISLIIFYTVFFGLIGIFPQTGVDTELDDDVEFNESVDDTISSVAPSGGIFTQFIDVIGNIFTTVQGFPTVINILIFSPLGVLAIFWVVKFIIDVIPFIGGGS